MYIVVALIYALIAAWEVPRLRREERAAELRAFWVLWAISLLPGLSVAFDWPLPLTQWIAAVLTPIGRLLTVPLS